MNDRREPQANRASRSTSVTARLQAALKLHQQGKWLLAKHQYEQLLAEAPGCADAHHLLGLCLLDLGAACEALTALRRAAQLADSIGEFHADLAAGEAACENWNAARAALLEARRRGVQIAERLHAVGLKYLNNSRWSQAVACFEPECEILPRGATYQNLGIALLALDRMHDAVPVLRRAVELCGGNSSAWCNLGLALQKTGDDVGALECFERAIAFDPNFHQAHFNLGSAHALAKRWQPALTALATACQLETANAEYWRRLATCHSELQQWAEAEQAIARAAQLRPQDAGIQLQFGEIVQHSRDLEQAIPYFAAAAGANENGALASAKLGLACKRVGDADRARTAFARVIELENSPEARFLRAMSLPVIYRDQQDLIGRRQQLEAELDQLVTDGVRLNAAKTGLNTTFLLAYQGFNDRRVQQQIAGLWDIHGHPDYQLNQATRGKRLRVGFLSSLLKYHTVGKLTRGWIKELDRSRFEVIVLSPYEHVDQGAQWIRGAADRYRSLSADFHTAARQVASERLDILIYPEVGMDPLTMALARLRLAPVQCAMWGHPLTTGLASIDYFLSSELIEPADGREHYSEQLISLATLPAFYYRPRLPDRTKDHGNIGLAADANIYLCPHTLFKMHPDIDRLLHGILERDRRGQIVLLQGRFRYWQQELQARFAQSLAGFEQRVTFLPTLAHPDYLRLLELSAVLLDAPHFGGGNTHYEAFSVGLPVVTRPSQLMRGRVAYGLYQKMQLDGCLAESDEHYIELAVQIANDRALSGRLREQIRQRSTAIYEDQQSTRELAQFLDSVCAPAGTRTSRRTMAAAAQTPVAAADPLSQHLRSCTCPACGHHVAVDFFHPGQLPLATLAWPADEAEARTMKRLPHDFVRCVDCGHVYNFAFQYTEVPYSTKPNLMFNRGALWQQHLQKVRELLLKDLPRGATVVEIGCGEGHLLRALAADRPDCRYIGFDPNASVDTGGMFQARAELFDPAIHLAECRPDLLISRHVLEHLMNPNGFIQALAFAVSCENRATRLFIEVPCIDHVIDLGRTVDFFYEHHSHFTTTSLEKMLRRSAPDIELVATSYNGEVVYALAQFQPRDEQVRHAREALRFAQRACDNNARLREQLAELHRSGRSVAIWGGTGKAAAFLQQHAIDCRRFPLVVDSDPDKAGTHVPGTGQRIEFRDYLLTCPAAVILIATQWRAADIVLEILRCGIAFETVLLEHAGRLVDYFRDEHPYQAPQNRSGFSPPAMPHPHIIHVCSGCDLPAESISATAF